MKLPTQIADLTLPYSRAEGWLYDRFLAPAVVALRGPVIERFLPSLPEGARVLDVGCGGGQLLLELHRLRPDLQLSGVDLAAHQIARARARAAKAGIALDLRVASALELPFEDGAFDGVVSVASIKHWPDQGRGMGELTRVLAPGGHLLVVEADRAGAACLSRTRLERLRQEGPLSLSELAEPCSISRRAIKHPWPKRPRPYASRTESGSCERSKALAAPPKMVLKACSRMRSRPSHVPAASMAQRTRSKRLSNKRRSSSRFMGSRSVMFSCISPPAPGTNGA